jgi:hypothetical protein
LCSKPCTALTPDGTLTPCPNRPGNFTPCNPFAPCSTNACASATDNPSTAAAITTPANDDRDSRNSNVSIPDPTPTPNSRANPGNPAPTHAPTGSRRNSPRNTGSTNNRSIKRPASSFSSSVISGSPSPLQSLWVQDVLERLEIIV